MTPLSWLILCLACGVCIALAVWLLARASDSQTAQQIDSRLPGGGVIIDPIAEDPHQASWLIRQFWHAGLNPRTRHLVLISGSVLLLAVVVSLVFGWLAGLMTIIIIPLTGWLFLRQRAAARGPRMASQLPAFLEHMQRALLAGNSFEEAFASASQEAPEPLLQITEQVTRQVHLGAAIESALTNAAALSRRRELATLALAARVNRRFGGSPRAMLGSIIQMVRQQESASRELRALTAETRFSAVVLAIIPVGITAYILLHNPGFYGAMWASGGGRTALIGAIVLQCLGVLAIWRMVRSVDSQ